MKTIKYFILIVILFPSLSYATNLRGRVDAIHPYSNGPFPARDVIVQLFIQTPNGPSLVNQYFTGSDGMYYLQNIMPGQYILLINNTLNFPLIVFDTRFQDIPPILLRY